MSERPLSGTTVVSLEQAVAAPFCSMRLAEAGARVIKVERPGGDFARRYDDAAKGQSCYFVWLNRGKQSVVLDLKSPQGRDILLNMVEQADIFIQNLAPGAADRLGIGSDVLSSRNGRLIQLNIRGYSADGPLAERKAYDLLIQADSGLASITGGPDAPARVGVSVCDIATGMYGQAAILEALIVRERTGRGAIIDISMFDAMADWMSVPLLQAEASGTNPPRLGLHHASIAPYGAYACGDGCQIVVAVQNEREWAWFCTELLERPELTADPRYADMVSRVTNRQALGEVIEAVFSRMTAEEVAARCESARIAFARVNDAVSLAAHPHLQRLSVNTQGGVVRPAASPARWHGSQAAETWSVPALDEHGEALRREFSRSGDDAPTLRKAAGGQ